MTRARKLIALALLAGLGSTARGDGVAQVMTAKTLPAATIAVIDPETGSSSGGGTTDVNVAPGDIILFKFKYFPVPDKIVHGMQGYLTEYIPANTEVVGVRITDANGVTIKPNYPGIATNGCARPCNRFNSIPSATGDRNLDDGSIAQLYADTGVFYTVDSRLTRNPSTAFLTLTTGITMSPAPTSIGNVAGILGASSPFRSHNQWDWVQVQAYGISTAAAENSGTGNTPYRYGSPVAGPQTWYNFEATEGAGGAIQFNDVNGPWQRILYPGSQIGTGAAVSGSGPLQRMNVDTAAGFDVKPATPLPAGTKAVRIALGEVRVGEPGFAEIALRVLATPIDPVQGADVDCAEVFGGDTSAASDTVRAKDNPWGLYLGSPACAFLNLLFDLDVDLPLAATGDDITYTLHGKNLSINPQTNVVPRLRYDSTRVAFISATGGPTDLATCDDGSGMSCLRWPAMTLAPSDEYTFTATFDVGGGGHITHVAFANYRSDQLPAPGFTTQAISMIKEVAVVRATLSAPIGGGTAGGPAIPLTGTVSNVGSGAGSYDTISFVLPAGWTVSGAVTLGGVTLSCASGCATSTPTYNIASSFAEADTRNLALNVLAPAGTATGLYDIDVQIWASMSGFGGSFETYFYDAATVSIGQGRSTAPVVSCPINAADTTISGTTVEADGTVIRVYFNGIQRCSAVAAGGAWSCTGFVGTFGNLYGGLEVRATADAPTELEGPMSVPCFVTTVPTCADFIDNDGDALIDFPADPGCDSSTDSSETDVPLECVDGADNDGDTFTDWPADPSCFGPLDPSETGPPQCSDGVDSDGDGLIDAADPGCTSPTDGSEVQYRLCMNGLDDDGDGDIDFPDDPGCHSMNDDSEVDVPVGSVDVRARLLVAFDTSGSMNLDTCGTAFAGGDGSAECAGADVACATCSSVGCNDGLANDSRLDKVKTGISDVLAAFGEVDYGLMRFHQRPVVFTCPTSNGSRASGGWQGAGAAPCSGGFAAGDLLVGFSEDNVYDMLEWMDGDDDYVGTPPPGLDLELRGSGTTPLAGILESADQYLADVQLVDPQVDCRPYRVILVTDGAETCGGDPAGAAAVLLARGIPVYVIGFATTDATVVANLNSIAAAGGTGTAIFVDDEVALSTAMSSIVTETLLVEFCNGVDDDCDGMIDEDFADLGDPCTNGMIGTCLQTGVHVCTADGLSTECNAPDGTPGTEVCNGADDDCDGLIDDGIVCTGCGTEFCNGADDDCDGLVDESPLPGEGNACGVDIGACIPGALICSGGALVCDGEVGPTLETCNNIDDDCDTIVDGLAQECYEFATGCDLATDVCQGVCAIGLQTCPAGSFGPCVGDVGPTPELCNGLDDDCDGATDEDFPGLGAICDNGMTGACFVEGTIMCTADGMGTFCTATPVTPGTEVCNGVDDDCDSLVDEDPLPPPIGNTCGGTSGCTAGILECVDGFPECVGATGGSPEVCNGVDDDCDGFVDEPPLPGVGVECTDPGMEAFGDVGECAYGLTECTGGGVTCVGYVGPTEEVCDGLDNDCDGMADDFAECPLPSNICHEGSCVGPCMPEFPCPFGFFCETLPGGDYCVPDPCVDIECEPGFTCNSLTAECEDLCASVECLPGLECQNGFCLDCFTLGCPEPDQTCVLGATGFGVCVTDPCSGVECDAGEFCQDGECVPLTCDPACPDDEECVAGECVEACSDEICEGSACGAGRVCNPGDGTCIVDPCLSGCPAGFVCEVTCQGTKNCVLPPDDGEDILATSAGGCACEVGASSGDANRSGGAVALILAAGVLLLRRRRSAR